MGPLIKVDSPALAMQRPTDAFPPVSWLPTARRRSHLASVHAHAVFARSLLTLASLPIGRHPGLCLIVVGRGRSSRAPSKEASNRWGACSRPFLVSASLARTRLYAHRRQLEPLQHADSTLESLKRLQPAACPPVRLQQRPLSSAFTTPTAPACLPAPLPAPVLKKAPASTASPTPPTRRAFRLSVRSCL